jgi:acetylglutamate kinase
MSKSTIRKTVLRSLSAIGATKEAKFYAELFAAQDAERFALIVIDPRCLKNPLLEALISNLKILSDLGLSPVLLVGALDDDRTSVKFQAQRLATDLDQVSVQVAKLNTASYGLIPEVRQKSRTGIIPILEMTERRGKMNLNALVFELKPNKVIFLQPSGGLLKGDERLSFVNIDRLEDSLNPNELTIGQSRFITLVQEIAHEMDNQAVYIIASPLNLLAELFTIKGSGTLLRRAAPIMATPTLARTDKEKLKASIEAAFEKPIKSLFLRSKIHRGFIEEDYRGGAIFTQLAGLPYLSKFWVSKAAQGEGIARDIWDKACADVPCFFWRSRMKNPFNDWYMYACDGMQISGEWRVFWKGLDAPEVPGAIIAAASAPDDFETPA